MLCSALTTYAKYVSCIPCFSPSVRKYSSVLRSASRCPCASHCSQVPQQLNPSLLPQAAEHTAAAGPLSQLRKAAPPFISHHHLPSLPSPGTLCSLSPPETTPCPASHGTCREGRLLAIPRRAGQRPTPAPAPAATRPTADPRNNSTPAVKPAGRPAGPGAPRRQHSTRRRARGAPPAHRPIMG